MSFYDHGTEQARVEQCAPKERDLELMVAEFWYKTWKMTGMLNNRIRLQTRECWLVVAPVLWDLLKWIPFGGFLRLVLRLTKLMILLDWSTLLAAGTAVFLSYWTNLGCGVKKCYQTLWNHRWVYGTFLFFTGFAAFLSYQLTYWVQTGYYGFKHMPVEMPWLLWVLDVAHKIVRLIAVFLSLPLSTPFIAVYYIYSNAAEAAAWVWYQCTFWLRFLEMVLDEYLYYFKVWFWPDIVWMTYKVLYVVTLLLKLGIWIANFVVGCVFSIFALIVATPATLLSLSISLVSFICSLPSLVFDKLF